MPLAATATSTELSELAEQRAARNNETTARREVTAISCHADPLTQAHDRIATSFGAALPALIQRDNNASSDEPQGIPLRSSTSASPIRETSPLATTAAADADVESAVWPLAGQAPLASPALRAEGSCDGAEPDKHTGRS